MEDIKNVHLDRSGKLSQKGVILTDVINRYAYANIPVDYWWREMDNFQGDQSLVDVYEDYKADIKGSYNAGKSYCFAGGHGKGKMQDLETEFPTPDRGFIKLKHLKEGDLLFDENGDVCTITKLHPIDYSPDSYRITFDDGEYINACSDHLWLTHTRNDRKNSILYREYRRTKRRSLNIKHKPYLESNAPYPDPIVKTTKQILETLNVGGKQGILNHSIPCCMPLKYGEKKLTIPPYILGCWLGDGTSKAPNITTADEELLLHIKEFGYNCYQIKSTIKDDNKASTFRIGEIGVFRNQLKDLGVFDNKHIPDIYMQSSVQQRLELLQGLMDTDGSCYESGRIEYCSVLPALAKNVNELALSLGLKSSIKRNKSYLNKIKCKDRYRITFTTDTPVFKLSRKLKNIRVNGAQITRTTHRFIKSVEKISPVPMRCITVNSPSHLYLVTRSCIATHNTYSACCILKRVLETGKYNGLYVNLTDIVNLMASSSVEDKEEKSFARKYLLNIDFLVIDEFDSRFMGTSDNAIDLFGRMLEPILRSRIQNSLPTILCTNNTNPDELFNNALRNSFKSLMKKIKLVPVLGKDHR